MKRLADLFCAASLISVMLLIVGPAQIYVANPNDFSFAFRDIVPFLVATTLLLSALLAVILSFLPDRLVRLILSIGCVVAVMVWLQGNFLVWQFGPLDGKPIDWSAHPTRAIAEGALWLLALLTGCVAARSIVGRRRWILGGLLTINVLYAAILIAPTLRAKQSESFYADEQDKFTFSSHRNIILLVLDTYQTDVFQELVNERPDVAETFRGFTYYRNAVGGFPFTLTAVPLMLTGQYYQNMRPYQEFVRQAFSGESVPGALKANGYQVDLFPYSLGYLASYDTISSNITNEMPYLTRARHASELIDLALFRYAPHALKRSVYADGKWTTSRWFFGRGTNADLRFFAEMGRQGRVQDDPGRFKLFHLTGMHAPLAFDENLKEGTFPVDRPNYKNQAAALTRLLRTFLDDLTRLGIYDNSMIVIAGDHGTTGYGIDVNAAASGRREGFHTDHAVPLGRSIVESGIPLVLVKPIDARGEFRISDAPVSHADLPKTMTDGAGIAAFKDLASMWDLAETAQRRRRFLSYSWTTESEAAASFPPLDEYWVNGFSWLRSSWAPSFRRFTDSVVTDTRPTPLSVPTTVRFGAGDHTSQYLGLGWAAPDKDFTWTMGTRAAMILPLTPPGAAVRLRAALTPLMGAGHDAQRVRTIVDGRLMREWVVSGPGAYDVILPDDLTPTGELKIELRVPDAISPDELGLSDDHRRLGVALGEVQLSPVPYYELGRTLHFGRGGDGATYEESGWSVPDPESTWTDGGEASLALPVRTSGALRLDVSLTPLLHPPRRNSQRIVVRANHHIIATWTASGAGGYTANIPTEVLSGSILRLTFELPDAISPLDLYGASDGRKLGAAVATLRLSAIHR